MECGFGNRNAKVLKLGCFSGDNKNGNIGTGMKHGDRELAGQGYLIRCCWEWELVVGILQQDCEKYEREG